MAYIGVQPAAGQYRKLDDVSAGFNGTSTTFTTSVSGENVTAGTAQQLLVSVGGVIQEPKTDYDVSTNSIVFTTAPAAGLDFFAVLMGDAVNTITVPDGSVTTAKLAGSLSVGLAGGTNSAPTLFFTGDTNTGVYSPGADQVAVTTGGTQRLLIDASGNVNVDSNTLYVDAANNRVGVGTSSPSEELHVVGDILATGYNRIPNANEGGFFDVSGNNGITIKGSTNASPHITTFYNSGGASVTIDASRRVGIGTASPSVLTHLSTSTDTQLRVESTSGSGTNEAAVQLIRGSNQSAIKNKAGGLEFFVQGLTNEVARIDSSGRLLVGTSTATNNLRLDAKLAVVSTGSGNFGGVNLTNYGGTGAGTASFIDFNRSRGTTDGSFTSVAASDALGYIVFRGATGSAFDVFAQITAEVDGTPGASDAPGRLVFSTTADGACSPTERMRIGQNGTVDTYGTPTESAYTARVSYGAGTIYGFFSGRHSASSTSTGTNTFFVYTNGNVVNSNGSYGVLSDIKLKENVVDAKSQWADIQALRIRNYNFKEETGQQTHTQIGLVAQEVELVSPGLVTESPDRDEEGNNLGTTTKSINQSVLYMKAVKALQEAMERIEQLEAEMAEVKAQLS